MVEYAYSVAGSKHWPQNTLVTITPPITSRAVVEATAPMGVQF